MEQPVLPALPIFLFVACALGLALGLLIVAGIFNRGRPGSVTRMPYESGMDPIHDTRRRFDVRFHLLAIAFLVFDVELLFLYPWAVVSGQGSVVSAQRSALSGQGTEHNASGEAPSAEHKARTPSPLGPAEDRHLIFAGVMTFVALLTAGFVYDWRKGVFQWR
jgi:NADH-quinone oxidoreductase subunit A